MTLDGVARPGHATTLDKFRDNVAPKIDNPIYQQKVDGVRCNIVRSENGFVYLDFPNTIIDAEPIVPHIVNALNMFFPLEQYGGMIIDGEMFDCVVGRPLTHAVKTRPEQCARWRFAAFDLLGFTKTEYECVDWECEERISFLEFNLPHHMGANYNQNAIENPLMALPRMSHQAVLEMMRLSDDVEGFLVKNSLAPHAAGRNKNWMKVKKWLTADLQVHSVLDKKHVLACFVEPGIKEEDAKMYKVAVPPLEMIIILDHIQSKKGGPPPIEVRAMPHITTGAFNMVFERIRYDLNGWDCDPAALNIENDRFDYDV
jgi:hypothetical protein